MLTLEEKQNLAKVRFEHSLQCLKTSQLLVDADDYKCAANRSYYAIFHAMRAVLAFDGYDVKKHSAVISKFRLLYIKTGVFDSKLSNYITDMFEMRNDSDYDDFYLLSKEDVENQINNAKEFLNAIKLYLLNKGVKLSE